MNILTSLACLAFLTSAIWFTIHKTWPHALIAAGLFLYALPATGLL